MQRRKFLKGIGISLSGAWIGTKGFANPPEAENTFSIHEIFPKTRTFDDVLNKEGLVMVRIALTSKDPSKVSKISGDIKAKGAKIVRSKAFGFQPDEDHLTSNHQFSSQTSLDHSDVMVLWLDEVEDQSEISIKFKKGKVAFTLGKLLEEEQLEWEQAEGLISVNFLLDKEIGYLDLADLGIDPSGNNFSFAIMADPQGGDPNDETNDSTTRMKVHNAFIEDSVGLINEMEQPLFNLVLGDIVDSKGQWSNFRVLLSYLKKVKCPTLWTVGNHESAYNIVFTPGYNMEGFSNFFRAQKEMNGMKEMLYAFDVGQWHFVVWPDPLRRNFWETHPHYFDWLEKDLEKHKNKPTVFFHHVPLLPIGIDPLINYVESVDVKRKVIDIITKHGNVKYALSGHVHIPLKASLKTARSYRGTHFINLPAAGYRPRAFGEADLVGGPVQGICMVDVHNNNLKIRYKTVTKQVFTYPDELPEFEASHYPLWLNHKWEIPAENQLQNGDFKGGLDHWHRRYLYPEDHDPSNLLEVRSDPEKSGSKCLFLYSKKRGFHIPGQDRMPQTLNKVCQVVKLPSSGFPILGFKLKIDQSMTLLNSFNGLFIWIEGYENTYKRLNLVYSFNKMYFGIGGQYSELRTVPPQHFDLGEIWNGWAEIQISLADDFDQQEGHNWSGLKLDKLAINLGTWTVNDGDQQQIGAYISNIRLDTSHTAPNESQINGNPIVHKKETDLWYGGIKHIAGEHIYQV